MGVKRLHTKSNRRQAMPHTPLHQFHSNDSCLLISARAYACVCACYSPVRRHIHNRDDTATRTYLQKYLNRSHRITIFGICTQRHFRHCGDKARAAHTERAQQGDRRKATWFRIGTKSGKTSCSTYGWSACTQFKCVSQVQWLSVDGELQFCAWPKSSHVTSHDVTFAFAVADWRLFHRPFSW